MMSLLLLLLIAGVVLVLVLGGGLFVLLKLGVFAHYALKPEPPEERQGDYSLEQSRPPEE